MGNNNLYKTENTLRSIAKRCKTVKYSLKEYSQEVQIFLKELYLL